ncbi:MAG: DUF2635 domain-containing protein [Negativicutes bacterium]|jgi:hypothetical protein
MFLIPVSGRIVHDPEHNDILPVDGREVEENQYWYRRIQDGDVVASIATITKKEVK